MRLLAAVIVFFMVSCNEAEPVAVRSDEEILKSKPFAGITDSIERSPDDVTLLLERATRLSQHNFYKTATADYEKAYKLTGDQGVALEYSSNLLLAEEVNKAVTVLKEGKRKFPENTEFSRRLAEIYMQNDAFSSALDEYDYMLSKDSADFEAWFEKGSMLAQTGDTNEAIAALEKSFSIVPINYSGLALANLYIKRKNPRALEICDIILMRDSASIQTEPIYMKGMFYTEVKQYDKAIEQFDECIKRDWKMTDAYLEKGIIYYETKDYNGALKTFNLAATVSNTDADVYYWMGRSYEASGKKQEAIVNYKRALSLDNNFTEAKDALRRLNG